MNRFSSSSETFSDSVATPTIHPSKDSDWELNMARLMGLNIDPSIDETDESTVETEDQIVKNNSPHESLTEQPIWSNPLAKLALVSAVTLGIVGLAGIFLSQIINTGSKATNKTQSVVEKAPLVKNELQDLSKEVETLKTKLALSEQVEAMKAAQKTLTRRSGVVNVAPLKTSITSPNVKIVYVPKVVTVEKIVKVPEVKEKNAQPSTVSKITQSTPVNKSSKPPKSVVTTTVTEPSSTLPNINNNQSVATAAVTEPENQPVLDRSLLKHISNPISANTLPTKLEKKNSLASGSVVKGILATSVFGETTVSGNNNSNEKEKNIFVIRLVEPLKSIDGVVVLPSNTELLAQVGSISEQGLLNLNVVKVIRKNKGTLTEIDLPKNAITITNVGGQPLIASQHPNNSSNIAGLDIGLFLLGGLGKIAELSNRTQSQVVTNNAAGSIITNANPRSNVLAGFIEGGSNSVVPQIAQRNQQAISTMMQRTNIWFLPAETEIEVHVNQLLQF